MIATTIKQSKELLRLGLPKEKFDMALCEGIDGKLYPIPIKLQIQANEPIADEDLCCSFDALFNIMRKLNATITLQSIDDTIFLRIKDNGFIWQKDIYAKDPLDAVYEGMSWLLKRGLINVD